ncbi:hypothetical protein SAMN05192574_10555 [Mucilaginibacter gossypiicola]|uniref:Prealbumin-like fold domain-containing protein n=1 Tax=Mucilaginibacter gossypiicola TaxID=551995 RepID=A0A1H8LE22_9SPHI|nr:hypothetical protein [Mucilaginibacter gossypiicola]SEO03391.1 hypothetical protein SAMN05192574_10555 [Mucilaginibacter gossypiicola]
MKLAVFRAILLFIFMPFAGNASAYWMEVKGSGKLNEAVHIEVCYGNIDEFSIRHRDTGIELTRAGDFEISIQDERGNKTALPMIRKADCWEATFIPAHTGIYRILGINDSHPVVDRSKTGGKNIRPVDYLCAAYRVGTGKMISNPAQLLDIIATGKNGLMAVKAFKDGRVVEPKTPLRVFNPENWEKELLTNEQGEAIFKPTMPGLYIIREDWEDPSPGNYKGVAYSAVRHRCNYCLQVSAEEIVAE